MVTNLAVSRFTEAEYLAFERASHEKHEFINGEILELTGASFAHVAIATNLVVGLGNQLRGTPCRPLTSDMRVKVSETGAYVYPDVVVVCGKPELEDEHVDTLLNPTLVIEILSPSTEAYDRGAKSAHYRRLPSLQGYVLIAQDRASVEHFRREGDCWILTEATELDAVMPIPEIGCELKLSEVCEGVEFPEPTGEDASAPPQPHPA